MGLLATRLWKNTDVSMAMPKAAQNPGSAVLKLNGTSTELFIMDFIGQTRNSLQNRHGSDRTAISASITELSRSFSRNNM